MRLMMEWKTVCITFFIFICMSISLTIEKISMIWCFETLRQPEVDTVTGYWMLLILTVSPSVVSLLQILWNVPFLKKSKESQCPRPISLIVGISSHVIEGACLVFFAATVAPVLPVYILIPLLNGVLTIPILLEELFKLKKNSQQKFEIFPDNQQIHRHQMLWKIISALVISLLPTVIGCLLYIRDIITRDQAICISATVIGLSIVWWPQVRKYALKTNCFPDEKPKKISIFYASIKVASIISSVAIHFHITTKESVDSSQIFPELIRGTAQLLKWKIGLPLILNFTSALFSHALAYLALALSVTTFGLVIPSVASTAATVALSHTLLGPRIFAIQEEADFRTFLPIAFATVVAFILWCYPYLIKTSDLVPKPPFLFMPFEGVFHSYGWDNIFFDQYLILGIKDLKIYENEAEKKMSEIGKTRLSRIFICTTMYREADYEMGRFLMSLRGLSTSSKLNDVILEAHVFMDNGCTSASLNEFAQQLVELSQEKLSLSISDGICAETPYGIQIAWKLPGGMPFFIHFKDPLKIKPKKRWSQAMYFQYILQFRLRPGVNRCEMKTGTFYSILEHQTEKTTKKQNSDLVQKLTSLVGNEPLNQSEGCVDCSTTGHSKNHVKKDNTHSNVRRSSIFGHNIEKVGYPTLFTNQSSVEISSVDVLPNKTGQTEHPIQAEVSELKTSSTASSFVSDDQIDNMAELNVSRIPQHSGYINLAFETTDSTDEAAGKEAVLEETNKKEAIMSNIMHQTKPSVSNSDSDSFSDISSVSSLGSTNNSSIQGTDVKTKMSLTTKTTKKWSPSPLPLLESIVTSLPKAKVSRMSFDEVPYAEITKVSTQRPRCSDDTFKDRTDTASHLKKTCGEPHQENTSNARWTSTTDEVVDESQVYILATDADMEFKDTAVLELLQMSNNDKRIGAACGRTHPQGKRTGPVVWHQIFEYAKDFWMIKTAQNVIGSVMCCPGCFSLYRTTAIQQVLTEYTKPTKSPFAVYVKDTGEDRWMATLLMVKGWYMRYSSFARNNTYCPDTFEEFLKQRRRWVLSDIANAVLVVRNLVSLIRHNACFSACYVIYMLNMFLNNIITPGTAVVMITAGLDLVFEVPYLYTTIPLAVTVLVYSVFCTRASTRAQTYFTLALTVILGCVFFAVVVWGSATIVRGIIIDIMAERFHFQQHYIIMLITVSFIYAASMHPSESYMVFYGLAYVFIFPAMHILLPIYSISNIVDQSWGTRDSQQPKKPKKPSIFRCMRRKRHKATFDTLNIKSNQKHILSPSSAGEKNAETENSSYVIGNLFSLEEGNELQQKEHEFWQNLRATLLGNDVNLGLAKAELGDRLKRLRNYAWCGMVVTNVLWLAMLSAFYIGISSPLSRLNVYGVISGALYGFTLVIQLIGLTAFRLDYLLRKLAESTYGRKLPFWVNQKE
ncbi:uncharacterized protein LOC118765089 [Octopus sinensis]|uniref:chitin synthase n=1 Tax=Octopus sinensis TaxID=2607531 RepID=A0A7E6F4H4_9MOLL|nr:uncharacterized protein LOC118765089 [Octopus sinensis]XP_036362448.1 uncharacterized protein LOC118765089 [Octopus sinensis]